MLQIPILSLHSIFMTKKRNILLNCFTHNIITYIKNNIVCLLTKIVCFMTIFKILYILHLIKVFADSMFKCISLMSSEKKCSLRSYPTKHYLKNTNFYHNLQS